MNAPERSSGNGGKLLAGLAVLPILCCGLPLLIGAGVFAGAGALLGSGTLVAVGLVPVLLTVAVAVRGGRRAADADCCRTSEASYTDRSVLGENR
jgi:hypothetical protein